MLNFLIAYDDVDRSLGDFFLQCYQDLLKFLHEKDNTEITNLGSDVLTKEKIQETISGFQQQPFICIAYSHGVADALLLLSEGEEYVNTSNSYFFANSFFYTFSCNTALELGQFLVDPKCKCHCFIGYRDMVEVVLARQNLFVECANSGIKSFINGLNALESVHQMLEIYENVVDKLLDENQTMNYQIIASLTKNKNALLGMPLGNEDITIQEFEYK